MTAPLSTPAEAPAPSADALMTVTGLTKHFPVNRGIIFRHRVGLVRSVDLLLSVLVPSEARRIADEVAISLQRTGARPVYAECNAIAPQTVLRPPEKILELNRWIKEYAARNNFVFLDYFSATVDDKGFFKSDRIAGAPRAFRGDGAEHL